MVLHFTESDFERVFTGIGATTSGFLSRCTLVADTAQSHTGDWRRVSSERVKELIGKMMESYKRTELPEANGVEALRLKVKDSLSEGQQFGGRLPFLFVQDLYFALAWPGVLSPSAVMAP